MMGLDNLDIPLFGTEQPRGALAAANFLRGKPAGLYTMRDVIESA
jgi:hypothetical protein